MESQNPPERTAPVQYARSRAFRQFKNPPQPHMCIQDSIKDTSEKLFINVLGWQKIANPKQYTDPIPLYGGMQVSQGCGPNSSRPPMLVFAVMVNPDILKANGKNAASATDREALVSLLCDFVEAMNPGLVLARQPVILRDRDLAGELKDVWLAVQAKREREKGNLQDTMYKPVMRDRDLTGELKELKGVWLAVQAKREVDKGNIPDTMYKVYDIDGIGGEEQEDDKTYARNKQNEASSPDKTTDKKPVKSSKQILLNAGQKSEFDSGMNNCQLNQNNPNRDNKTGNTNADTTYCTPVYGQIVSTRENHNQINEIQQKFASNDTKPSSSFEKDARRKWSPPSKTTEGWDEFSKKDLSAIKNEEMKKPRCFKTEKTKQQMSNGKHYDFFPYFDNKTASDSGDIPDDNVNDLRSEDSSKIILEPLQKLVLHATDSKLCDNKASALSSIGS